MWDDRYREPEPAFGTRPNDFLVAQAPLLPGGRILSLAEGQGRNAVFLAALGHRVTGVDASPVGLAGARALAAERGVEVETVLADLADFPIEPGSWAGIVSIFAHLPPATRQGVHRRCVQGLRPGGVLLLEAYSKRQLELGTGGPPSLDLLYSAEELREDLRGLELLRLEELEREVIEGRYHTGLAAVVQVVGRKPTAG